MDEFWNNFGKLSNMYRVSCLMTMNYSDHDSSMDGRTALTTTNRRQFIALTGGAVATLTTTGGASADYHEDDESVDTVDYTGEDVVEIDVGGPDGDIVFDPAAIRIDPGTTVIWTWESGNHNIVPDEIPDESDWAGVDELQEPPYDHEWTFQVPGEYEYFCTPHEAHGMVGTVVVAADDEDKPDGDDEAGDEDNDMGYGDTDDESDGEYGDNPDDDSDDMDYGDTDDTSGGGDGELSDDDNEASDGDDDEVSNGDDEADDDGPGFGVAVALAAVGGAAYVVKRRLAGGQTE